MSNLLWWAWCRNRILFHELQFTTLLNIPENVVPHYIRLPEYGGNCLKINLMAVGFGTELDQVERDGWL